MKRTQRIIGIVGSAALAMTLSSCVGGLFGAPTGHAGSAVPTGAGPVVTAPGSPTQGPAASTSAPAASMPATTPATTAVTTAATAPAPTKVVPAPAAKVAAKPASGAMPKPAAAATAKPAPKAAPNGPRTTLHPGDKGDDVRAMQTKLSRLGYWLGAPDGSWGNLTTQAVLALQKSAGIGRDAIAGPATMRALANGVRPRTTLRGNGVEIDKARQVLMIVRGGSVKYILNTSTGGGYRYTSSAGNPAIATTPSGTFRVTFVVNGMDHGKLGDLWRPRYFNGGIAVHGAGSVPAYPASHGCARVSNAAMDWIWANNLMPMGSTVKVR